MKNITLLITLFFIVSFPALTEPINYNKELKNTTLKISQSINEFYSSKNPVIAIIPSKEYSKDENELYNLVENEIQETLIDAGVTIISPSRREVLLEELKFSLSGLTDNNSAIQVGKMLNITTFLFVKIEYIEGNTRIYLELVDIETGKLLSVGKIVLKEINDPLKAKNLLLGNQIRLLLRAHISINPYSEDWISVLNYPLDLPSDGSPGEAAKMSLGYIVGLEIGVEYFYSPFNLLYTTLKFGGSLPHYDYSIKNALGETINTSIGGSSFSDLSHIGLTAGYGHNFSLSDFLGIILKTGVTLSYDWNNQVTTEDSVGNWTINNSDFSKGVFLTGANLEAGIRINISSNVSSSLFFGYNAYIPTTLPLLPQLEKVFPHYPVWGLDTTIMF